jgi:hypothetical protein
MTRAKKIEEYLSYPYTPEIQLEHPSGWCMSNYHDGCKYQFNHGKCGCKCHTQTPKTQVVREEVAFIADSNDPRPWRINE